MHSGVALSAPGHRQCCMQPGLLTQQQPEAAPREVTQAGGHGEKSPGRPSALPSSEPAGDAPGAGARERPRPAHCGSHAPLSRAEAGGRHLRLEPQLGLEGRLLEWAWRVSRSLDPQLSLRAGFRSSILWSARETASCPVSEWWCPAVASGQGVEPGGGGEWPEGIRLLGGTKLHLPAVGVRLG